MKNLSKKTKSNLLTYLILILAFVICQSLVSLGLTSNLFKGLLVPICINIILAMSLNLTVGISGELSLGHAGFMCVGAYAGSLFSLATQETITQTFIRFPLAILVGGIFAAIFGVLIGIPVLRLRGDYLAIVTLAFGEIIKNLFNNLYLITDKNGLHIAMSVSSYNNMELDAATKNVLVNGSMGITGTPNNSSFWVAFILILITLTVILNLVNSKTGRAVMSIRDNRIAAESVGINVTKYKLIAFVISAFFAGIAGVLYSHNLHTLTAPKFDYNMSILILVFVVLGGMGSMRGSIIAAAILTALPELLRGLRDYRMLIYALVLILMMLLNNNDKFKLWLSNITSKVKQLLSKIFKKDKKAENGGDLA